jgi:hypothetical protein
MLGAANSQMGMKLAGAELKLKHQQVGLPPPLACCTPTAALAAAAAGPRTGTQHTGGPAAVLPGRRSRRSRGGCLPWCGPSFPAAFQLLSSLELIKHHHDYKSSTWSASLICMRPPPAHAAAARCAPQVKLEGVQARLDLAERQVAARDALLAEMKGALAERDSATRRQAAHVGQLEQHIRWARVRVRLCSNGGTAYLQGGAAAGRSKQEGAGRSGSLTACAALHAQGQGRRAAAAAAAAGGPGGALRRQRGGPSRRRGPAGGQAARVQPAAQRPAGGPLSGPLCAPPLFFPPALAPSALSR